MKVFIVDPDAVRRADCADALSRRGHEVVARGDLGLTEELPIASIVIVAGPHLVELCARYRRELRARWILGLGELSLAEEALAGGADDFLCVPMSPERLALRLTVAERSGAIAADVGGGSERADPLGSILPEISARQLRAIFDLVPLPALIAGRDGEIHQCNRELERMLRQRAGTVAGRRLAEVFDAREVAALTADIQTVSRVRERELSLRDRYGNDYRVAADVRWIPSGDGYIIGVFTDITERRLTEEALRQSEASLRSVFEASPDGIIVHSEGRYVYVNPAARAQLGIADSEALVGSSVYDRIHPSDVARARARVAKMFESGAPEPVQDIRFMRSDGEVFIGEVASIPATFMGVPAVISIIRDAGEQRQMQSQLYLADRLATVGTLAVGVAHEINNPLSWVIGNLGLLADELDEQVRMRDAPDHDPVAVAASRARIRELLSRTQEGTERVRRIARDLGRFARPDSGDGQRVDVHALLDSTIEIADLQVRHRARLLKHYQAVTPVLGSEARLGQVFLNLLVNAAQAIAPGTPRNNRVDVYTRNLDDGRVEVEITDTGCGIPPDKLERIFDPFFTTKPVGEGTGIGLAITHEIITAHGGELVVESQVDVGTRFFVRLPGAEIVDDDVPRRVIREPSGVVLRSARVLVVDDEPMIREMVSEALARHEVATVGTATEALQRIVSEDWDIILCDVILPELTGAELWERVHAQRPEACRRIVFMTGGDFPTQLLGRGLSDAHKLDKPFSIKTLRSLVERFVEDGPPPLDELARASS
ncbi:sensory box histidine kinase/response regulator [Plesiocystis pacifica SIR-1]|uniref:histidine kinase n=1 Tax=Plesiocystis pacifica SIR-1 TaxID=391625 RepID=A6G5I4_9BACT|nr:PAS domain S-box protein [Plesiocystis pacifica]EDM78927.1 sensory box histidine kinase/response regulator [Plesiocystis pacifica SIR-1]